MKNYITGVMSAIMTGFMLIMFGLLLSLTVIGMIIGIPLMLAGTMQIFLSPFIGAFLKFEKCPNCGSKLLLLRNQTSSKCYKCKQVHQVHQVKAA